MATNLAIDGKLLDRAKAVGGHKTKRETVNQALREYIQRHARRRLSELYGTIDYDPNYDYKRERRAR
jgi:Arc/MetJ family transcription regulator